jgi:hypothetical protein
LSFEICVLVLFYVVANRYLVDGLFTPSPLHAEASALNLAAGIANHLQISQISFLIDNLTLARAAASKRSSDPHIPWEIREQIAIFRNNTRNIEEQVHHIKREFNIVTHSCAQHAIRQGLSRPILSCSNSAHQISRCPVILAFQNLSIQGFVLHIKRILGRYLNRLAGVVYISMGYRVTGDRSICIGIDNRHGLSHVHATRVIIQLHTMFNTPPQS